MAFLHFMLYLRIIKGSLLSQHLSFLIEKYRVNATKADANNDKTNLWTDLPTAKPIVDLFSTYSAFLL